MPTRSAARLARLLHTHGLLTPGQLRELDDSLLDCFPRTVLLARELLRRGWLTRYQLKKLARGQGEGLVRGSYRVLERLGRGGTGKVYKIQHIRFGRLAALKVLRRSCLADPAALVRFRREVRVAARLNHPNIVRAYSTVRFGSHHGLVMEYVDGQNLGALVQQHGPLPVDQACAYVGQAAAGLQQAFERGVVHRDIKPSNLLLTKNGVVKIADFGVARLPAEAGGLTRPGLVVGTVDYIAPEQALDARRGDVRADLYSLGCTFYYLLIGQPPFAGGSAGSKLVRHYSEEPRPVEELRPETPAAVAAVLRRLLAKRPEDRYQTPQELVTALATAAPGQGSRPTWVDGITLSSTPLLPESLTNLDFAFAQPTDRLRRSPQARGARPSWRLLGMVGAGLLLGLLVLLLCGPLLR